MNKQLTSVQRTINLAKGANVTSPFTRNRLLSTAIDKLFDFLQGASFLKLVFNIKSILDLVKEIISTIKTSIDVKN